MLITKFSCQFLLNFDFVIAILGLCAVDMCLNYRPLQILGNTLLGAIILSIAIGLGLAITAHVLGLKIQTTNSVLIKRLWLFAGLLGAGTLFFILGTIRQEYLNTNSIGSSPFLWAFFNVFFFAVAVVLASQNLPSKEQWLEHKKLKDINKELRALKNQNGLLAKTLAKADLKLKKLKQRLEVFRNYRDKLLTSLDKEEKRIKALCQSEFELKGGTSQSSKTKKAEK